ncbi:hypothetical protein F5B20DRAFT_567996 [Whalleya microplaca]|nr:hypothetical protein F5B20DRAFT_567996 [Whalleya microplaca]
MGPTAPATVAATDDESVQIPQESWNSVERRSTTTLHNSSHQQQDGIQLLNFQPNQNRDREVNTSYNAREFLVQSQSQVTRKFNLAKVWWREVTACLLAVAMLAALVGTISPYQGNPLPQWPYHISINTLVAIYSEAMKAAMILVVGECLGQLKWSWFKQPRPLEHLERYDSASRGSWGSLVFICTLRAKHRVILPYIGAVVMILAILIVPFAQQVVQFYSCTIRDLTRNATIPKSNFAHSGTSIHIGAGLSSIDTRVQNVLNSAVYESERNCTFPSIYHAIGWCSHCTDISNQLVISQDEFGVQNFTLPSSNLSATPGFRTFVMGGSTAGPVQAILGWNHSNPFKLSNTPWGELGYGAAECSITPCLRSYTGSVSAGNLTEVVVSSSERFSSNAWMNSVDISCLNSYEKDSLHNAGYDFDDNTEWLAYNLSGYAPDAFNAAILNNTNTTIRPECVYQTYQNEVWSLSNYLGTMFSGYVSFGSNALSGDPLPQAIFQEGNVTFSTIDDTFNRVANALTVWNRQNGDLVVGQVYKNETCVSAQWSWLAYPLALVLGMIVFLTWTIDETRRFEGSYQDYKSSALALLFHRLGSVGSEGLVSGIKSATELNKQAKDKVVVFQGSAQVWRFVEVDKPGSDEE